MSRSFELPCFLYGSILCRTKYSKGRTLLSIFLLPLSPKPDFHLNKDGQEEQALGDYLLKKKDEKHKRRKRWPECG